MARMRGGDEDLAPPSLVEVPALQLLADPGDDAGDVVVQRPENLFLPHVGNGAVAGMRMSSPQLSHNAFGRVLKIPE
eukprot:1600568-Alexandrium_andersonii.AAC.1